MRPTHERLREALHYEPETGVFTWLVRTSIRVMVGDMAGTRDGPYLKIKLDGQPYRAHIWAWFYMNAEWPEMDIDHIDGDGLNNRWANLRLRTRAENMWNVVAPRSDNTSGYLGVSPSRGRWQAQITARGKRQSLGYFDTPEEASAAYWAAKAELHGEESYLGRTHDRQWGELVWDIETERWVKP